MKTTPSTTVTAGDLRPALTALAKVVNKKGKAADPIQQHFKVETVNRSTLRFTATDLATFFTIDVPATIPEKLDPFLLPLAAFQDRMKGTRAAEPVELHPTMTHSVSEFPEIPSFRTTPVQLETRVTESLLKAMTCGSKDQTRHVLNGVCLDVTERGSDRIVATDGRHLLSANSFTLSGLKESVILPAHPVYASPVVREPGPWELRMSSPQRKPNPGLYRIIGPTWTLAGHLVDGKFPNYRQVIPPDENFKTRITISEATLEPLVKAIGQLPGRKAANSPVGLRIDDTNLGIIARGGDDLAYEEVSVPLIDKQGSGVTVFLNREYLEKALRFGMNRIEVVDESSPVRCRNQHESMIIMPIRCPGKIEVAHTRALVGKPVNGQPKPKTTRRSTPVPGPKPPASLPAPPPPPDPKEAPRETADPVEFAAAKISEIKTALKAAVTGLNGLTAALKTARQQQRQAEKEIQTVRKTIRSLKRVEL